MSALDDTVRMQDTEISGGNSDGEFNSLIFEEGMNYEEHPPHPFSEQKRLQVSIPKMTHSRCVRLTPGVLGLLAAVLFIIDVSLGVHYNKLTDAHLTIEDTESIVAELTKLQDTYKTAFKVMTDAQRQVDVETKRQMQTNWELEFEKKRTTECEKKIQDMPQENESLKSHLSVLNDGCKHCSAGWAFISSMCYRFSSLKVTQHQETLSWYAARQYCQLNGGDLAIIDSREKQMSIGSHLRGKLLSALQTIVDSPTPYNSFWIGLSQTGGNRNGRWVWVNQTALDVGYWREGMQNIRYSSSCAAVYPNENFFQAWTDWNCDTSCNWICEKTPISS